MKTILKFLTDIRANNNREWFAAHRDEYLEFKEHLNLLTEKLIAAVAEVDPDAARLTVADCTYRIFRDIRFSNDKTPYKTHAGIFINPPFGKKSMRMGYYIHLEPGNVFFCAGTIGLPSKTMTAMRQAIRDNIEEYAGLVLTEPFTTLFESHGEDFMKTAPKGFDRNWEYIDLVRPKNFCAVAPLKSKDYLAKDFPTRLRPYLELAKRYNDFHNYTIDEMAE